MPSLFSRSHNHPYSTSLSQTTIIDAYCEAGMKIWSVEFDDLNKQDQSVLAAVISMKLAWRHDVHLIIGEGIPAGTGLASAAVTRGLGGGNEAIAWCDRR
jgi:hypothetical protein